MIPMQIRYIVIYFIPPHIRNGQGCHSYEVSLLKSQSQLFMSKKLAHCSTLFSGETVSTYHYLQLQKILPDRFPVTHSVQN